MVPPITAWLGLSVLFALSLAVCPRDAYRTYDDVWCCAVLGLVWFICCNAQQIAGDIEIRGVPAERYVNASMDALFLPFAAYMAKQGRQRWQFALVGLALFQCLTHVAIALGDNTRELSNAYKAALNISFLAQVVCVATPGGLNELRFVLDRMRHRRMSPRSRAAR